MGFLKAFLITILFLTTGSAIAGVGSSGGGFALVCRQADGRIGNAILLDLYEAQVRLGLKLPRASGSLERDYLRSITNSYRLKGNDPSQLRPTLDNLRDFFRLVKMTKAGERLPRLNDLGEISPLPRGCHLEQLAIFYDAKPIVVRIDSEIWKALDSLSQAALVSHELYYRRERIDKEPTSETTRALVGRIYAASGVVPTLAGVPRDALSCSAVHPSDYYVMNVDPKTGGKSMTSTRLTIFFAYPLLSPQGQGYRLQFYQWVGRSMVSKTAFDLPGIGFELKQVNDRTLREWISYVTEPNQRIRTQVRMNGASNSDWILGLHYETGKPFRISASSRGQVLSEQYVTTCTQGTWP
jgi:hypothetical protein